MGLGFVGSTRRSCLVLAAGMGFVRVMVVHGVLCVCLLSLTQAVYRPTPDVLWRKKGFVAIPNPSKPSIDLPTHPTHLLRVAVHHDEVDLVLVPALHLLQHRRHLQGSREV